MHMLHLLRHAKSSWKEEVEDHERRLNRRGRKAARWVGRNLLSAVGSLDLVLCSSAVRTRETMELVLADYTVWPRHIIENELYAASLEKLTERLRRLAESDINVLLIAHNPGLHELAITLADARSPCFPSLASGKFPTAARATFRVSDSWLRLGRSRYQLVDYVIAESLHASKS